MFVTDVKRTMKERKLYYVIHGLVSDQHDEWIAQQQDQFSFFTKKPPDPEEVSDLSLTFGAMPNLLELLDNNHNMYYDNPIFHHAETGQWAPIALLHQLGARVDLESFVGQPIHIAALFGHTEIVEQLVLYGADYCAKDSNGAQPIHLAALGGYPDTVRRLLEMGAKIDARSNNGEQPVHMASKKQSGGLEALSFLVERGAAVNSVDDEGKQPIHKAKTRETLDFLLFHGANVDARDKQGRQPIHYAAQNYFGLEMLQCLVRRGADAWAEDEKGVQPLHLAVRYDYSQAEKARFLLNLKVPVDIKDSKGRQPIHYACENRENGLEIVLLLVKWGAHINAVDYEGNHPCYDTII